MDAKEAGKSLPDERRATGEFDPREGFFPQSLMQQVEAVAARDRLILAPPPAARAAPRLRPLHVLLALLVALLVVAAYWLGQRRVAPVAGVSAPPARVAKPAPASPSVAPSPPSSFAEAARVTGVATPAPEGPAASPPAVGPAGPATPPSSAPANEKEAAGIAAKAPPAAVAKVQPVAPRRTVQARDAARAAPASAPDTTATASPGYTGGVTHTRGGVAPPPPAEAPRVTLPAPPVAGGSTSNACGEPLAALGLCAPTTEINKK